jgi:hypothetical protein
MAEVNNALERKLNRLQRYASMIESLAIFLTNHPKIADRCELKELYGKVGLDFDEKGLIVPMGKTAIVLRLSRYASNVEIGGETLVCSDVSKLSTQQLHEALLEIGVDLNKPDGDDDDED